MKKEEIINNIVKEKPLSQSKELLEWVQQSDENMNEYAGYKNVWALLHRGNGMKDKTIAEGLLRVKRKTSSNIFNYKVILKYAAIIVLALISGFFVNRLADFNTQVAMNEITVPHGNRSLIVLPDQSEVWLTNGSKLLYPESFTGNNRNIKLEGEAYFKVTHNQRKPFVVDLGGQKVTVMGTEFSVRAYPDDNFIHVDLVSGKVKFEVPSENNPEEYKSYIMQPLHSLELDKTSGTLKTAKIPDSFYKYWQEGIYEFNDESFGSLAKKIHRIYGVDVIFDDSKLKESKFTGAFYIDSNIYTIIETFKRASSMPFEYSIDKNYIYINCVKKN